VEKMLDGWEDFPSFFFAERQSFNLHELIKFLFDLKVLDYIFLEAPAFLH
jgi:hypothetical protein